MFSNNRLNLLSFIEHIVRKLELLSVQIGGTYDWVFTALMDTGIALPKLFEVYNK